MEGERELIILVDDDPANLRIGSNVLETQYDVATAPSAAKLFSLLENNNPAVRTSLKTFKSLSKYRLM